MENAEEDEKGDIIEDRANGTDKEYKTLQLGNAPLSWLDKPVVIDLVRRYGGLGEVVQQVVRQHLDRQHRQEREKGAGTDDAEHIAEIGAGGHLDVFDNVAENAPAFGDALLQHEQAVFEEDDIGRLFGDVDRAVYGNTDVGGFQGRGVVDPIAQESRDMAATLECLDDSLFLVGYQAGEDIVVWCSGHQFVIAEALDIGAEKNFAGCH